MDGLWERRKQAIAAAMVASALWAVGAAFAGGAAVSATSPRSFARTATGVIAFKCADSLCLTRPDGTGRRKLFQSGPSPQWDPTFAPAGRRLAFRGYYGLNEGDYALYVVGTNGCGVRRLTRSIASNPSWSPKGDWIAFDTSGGGEIWKIRSDGTGLTRIAAGGDASFPSWSPDGNRIAFVRNQPGQGQVWLVRADGSRATKVHSDAGAGDQAPTWSPDGNKLAFTLRRYPRSWIEVMNADGKNARALTKRSSDASNPVWLPDGLGIAFLAGESVYVMRPNGTGSRAVADLTTIQFAWTNAGLPRKRC
jgi:Tol biopolymer transport system component